ncbi:MAG TPA: SdrD B-like domain-containing protein [Verrucomicrobiae bacterium]|nr:SdrD B-like domain-containing protein [Verrucomicrobiae bacterium]
MKQNLLVWIWCATMLSIVPGQAISFGPFGSKGQGGSKNGQPLLIGAGSDVFELDAFLRLGGLDLNGPQVGTSAQLSLDSLPAGLSYSFSSTLGTNSADLILTYTFSNTTANVVYSNLTFLAFLDAEIEEATNTFYNEYGTTAGYAGAGVTDPNQWQIDEPGFENGMLLRNLFAGALSSSNSVPQSALNDVAMSLGFSRNLLWPGDTFQVQTMVSEAGHSLGGFSLLQHDQADAAALITFSGQAKYAGLSGTVFADSNTNGLPDPGEGVSNVLMVLQGNSGSTLAQEYTDKNGHYDFGTPPGPGPFTVSVTPATLPSTLTNNVAHPNPGTEFSATRTLSGTNAVLDWGYLAPSQQFVNASGQIVMGFIKWELDRATGSLLGTLTITNPVANQVAFGPPFQVGLKASTNFYYPHPAGTLRDGVPYVDVSAGVKADLSNGLLEAGQNVVLTNSVEVYSLTRSVPPMSLFEIWATQH